ncbi:hypothetical protein RND81_04G212100 [Saponaria officinalis]|uniref:RING-CH-type domain-containing protein n=1 Tax=Saponaria officinalis TaxID=3572 RepID=A0AAW1LK85_SAPOF
MMGKEDEKERENDGPNSGSSSPIKSDTSRGSSASEQSIDDDLGLPTCRVCQCVESDKSGDTILAFLGIHPPLNDSPNITEQLAPDSKGSVSADVKQKLVTQYVQFISPKGEVFVCNTDLETGLGRNRDPLIELGCSCKNDLALVHYACALKWFVNHGSTVCEVCGRVATNIKTVDFKMVLASLKEYETLRDRTESGAPNPAQVHDNTNVDPDAIAAIRRLRLSEIYSWFNPHNNNHHINGNVENAPEAPLVVTEQPSNIVIDDVAPPEHPATKWAVEENG